MKSSIDLLKEKDFEESLLEWLSLINDNFKSVTKLENFLQIKNISSFVDIM